MRPYFILCVVVLLAVAAFGQQPVPGPYGCFYGCGPFIPRLTTPEISLQQFSPNPVGATSATTGLIAGATSSTLSQIQGSTSSVYTVAVWYEGGTSLISRQVHVWPETVGREGRVVHEAMHDGMVERREPEARPDEGRLRETRLRDRRSEERAEERGGRAEARADWTFFAGPAQNAGHVYGNDDVTRQNGKNGAVKFGGKTEKM